MPASFFVVTRMGIGRLARRSPIAADLTTIQVVIQHRFLCFPAFYKAGKQTRVTAVSKKK